MQRPRQGDSAPDLTYPEAKVVPGEAPLFHILIGAAEATALDASLPAGLTALAPREQHGHTSQADQDRGRERWRGLGREHADRHPRQGVERGPGHRPGLCVKYRPHAAPRSDELPTVHSARNHWPESGDPEELLHEGEPSTSEALGEDGSLSGCT